jgi:hypothetical protein
MVTFTQGQKLGPGDLSLLVRDASGQLVEPNNISYTIFQLDKEGNEALVSPPAACPKRSSRGAYYVDICVPTAWCGEFRLAWSLQQYPNSDPQRVYEDFQIVFVDPAKSSLEASSMLITQKPGLDKYTAAIVVQVREILSDTNPDRNYHFRPPTPGKVVAGYTNRVGYIWTDDTIIRLIKLNISKLNTWNPKNLYGYTIETIPPDWANCAALGAAASCLTSEACRWAADEFSYSLNGVAIDLPKTQLYQGLAQSLQAEFAEWAPLLTANRPTSAGLRQQRWILG